MCSILLQNPRLESSAKTTFGHGTLPLFNARLESCQREKKIVATKSLQMVAAVICNQVHLCRSQVDFLNYQYVNVEQNVIFQFRFNSNRLNFIEVEEIESEMCADKSFRTVVAAT